MHYFIIEDMTHQVEAIVDGFAQRGYEIHVANKNGEDRHLLKNRHVVSIYPLTGTPETEFIGGTIVLSKALRTRFSWMAMLSLLIWVVWIASGLVLVAVVVIMVATIALGAAWIAQLFDPISPYLLPTFLYITALLLAVVCFPMMILPEVNRRTALKTEEDILTVLRGINPDLEITTTKCKVSWPNFEISEWLPEEIRVKLQKMVNSFPQLENIENLSYSVNLNI
jgi:hypothetical protein